MAARIGMGSGVGIAGAFARKHPMWLIAILAFALLILITDNIASELAATGVAVSMLGGGLSSYVMPFSTSESASPCSCATRQLTLVLQRTCSPHGLPGASTVKPMRSPDHQLQNQQPE